ncbi:hypothetical protein [Kitasatospora sp. GP82]|uniref:hypothetical protein n=1 Tax=Kitasatospora sp. GP82 TaxID=3035089 RepID=UPI0024738E56|nr:hypothetical protein [Kitasatospora sp. GP82]MDH6130370.1 hypothetical protein [Kitasatospora sp. GP82]
MTSTQTTTQPAPEATDESRPVSHNPRVAVPIPPRPAYAPSVPASDDDSVYVDAAPAAEPDVTPRQATAPQRPQAPGIPAGPLMLTLANLGGIATTTALYAGGIPGVAAVGTVAGAAGALRTAYAFRRVSRGRGYGGYGYGGLFGGRGLRGGRFGRWGAGRHGGAMMSPSVGLSGGTRGSGTRYAGSPATGDSRADRVRSPFLGKQHRRAAAEAASTMPSAAGRAAAPGVGGPVSLGKVGHQGAGAGSAGARGGASRQAGQAGVERGGIRGALSRLSGPGSKAGQTIAAARRRTAPVADRVGQAARDAQTAVPGRIRQAGSAAARAWKDSARTRRNQRRWWRVARKATVSFVLAAVAGTVAQVLQPWRWGAGWRAGVRVWNWRANRSRAKEDVRDAKATAADAKATRKPRKATVTDPGRRSAPAAPAAPATGGDSMSAPQVFARAAEAVASAYQQYSPPHMLAVAAEYEGLPAGIRSAAKALGQLALNTAERYPAHKAVAEAVTGVVASMLTAAQTADEIAPAFRHLHADDIARHTAPRNGWTGEQMWNIGAGTGGSQTYESVFARSAAEVETAYAKFDPARMPEVGAEYESLPAGIEHLAAAVQSLAVNSASSYAVDPQIPEMVGLVHHRLMQAVSEAQSIMPLFRRVHAKDLARHEAPRNGIAAEAMWNV